SQEVCRTLEKQKETISKLQTEKRDNISKMNALQEKPKGTQTAKVFKHKFSYPKQHQGNRSRGRNHHWVCHYCGRRGHIRPFCYKLYGYPERKSQPRPIAVQKKEWRPKSEDAEEIPNKNEVCLIAHTSLRVSSRED
ncbi:gag-protease polyprotein, partial [Trifolium pratense]